MSNVAMARRVYGEVEAHVADQAVDLAREIAYGLLVGQGSSPGVPVDTRQARASGIVGVNSLPVPRVPPTRQRADVPVYIPLTDLAIAAALAPFRLGDRALIALTVEYAYIIAVYGRRPDRRGRMVGSVQAVNGTVLQAIAEARRIVGGA